VWLRDSTVSMSWDAGVKLSRLEFVSVMPTGSVPALEKSAEFAAAPGRVFWEAETVAKQEHGLAKPYTHRTFLSNGAGLGEWRDVGHSLTWTVDVPTAGRYALVLKAAVWEEAGARRAVQLDGNDLNDGMPSAFACTGGVGAEPAQWTHFAVGDTTGAALPFELTAGLHTLTLVGYGGGMNLDYLALVPLAAK
jgi:hypothetical protein